MARAKAPAGADIPRKLARIDPRMGALVRRVGPFAPEVTRDPFSALIGSILHQQISMIAAMSLKRRLKEACGGKLTPATILALREEQLRQAGLSRQKAVYVREIASHFAGGALSAAKLRRMSDEELIEATTTIKGVGRWTAEMLLIFCLERPDVWPVDDLGLRKGLQRFLGLTELPSRGDTLSAGEPFRPYRTHATWYLWRSLDLPVLPGVGV